MDMFFCRLAVVEFQGIDRNVIFTHETGKFYVQKA